MPSIGKLVVTSLVLLGTSMCGFLLLRCLGSWAGLAPWSLSVALVGLGLGGAVAIFRADVRARLALTLALLAVSVLVVGAHAAGYGLLPDDPWHSRIYTAVLATLFSTAGVGIVKRRPWSRWAVLGLGACGTLCGIMNLSHVVDGRLVATLVSSAPVPAWLGTWLWSHVLLTSASVAFLVLLAGRRTAEAFAVPASDPAVVWGVPHALVAAVKVTFVAQLVAASMSLLYALAQPVVPATRTSALLLAVGFAVAASATLARKTAGVLLLLVTGAGFAAQATATLLLASGPLAGTAAYYAVFWGLAGLASIGCGLVLARTLSARA